MRRSPSARMPVGAGAGDRIEHVAGRTTNRAQPRRDRKDAQGALRRRDACGRRRSLLPIRCRGVMRRPGVASSRIRAPGLNGAQRIELTDVVDGIEAARQIGRLAARVAELVRAQGPISERCVVAVWPRNARCGLSLYRPVDLDKLAESNYLNLRFSRELHWTALLTAVDLINNHARMLWRLVESQLTAAPLEARYQLMRRLAGARALTGRHADQLRALSAPDALFLSIEPVDTSLQALGTGSGAARSTSGDDDAVVSYCVRLNSLDRSATVVERNPVPRERLERVLKDIDAVGGDPAADPKAALERLACCGSLLGDDILYGIGERLAEVVSSDGRPIHLYCRCHGS